MEVARGEINVSLNDAEALAGLRAIDEEFDRTMSKIEHEEAKANIGANLTELKKDLITAKAMLKDFEKQRAEATTTADRRSTAALLSNQRKRVQGLQAEVNEAQKLVSFHGDRIKAINREEKASRALTKAIREQSKENQALTHGVTQQRAEIARLQQQYAKAQTEAAKLQRVREKLTTRIDPRHAQRVEIDRESAVAQMFALRAKLEALGAHPIEIEVDVDEQGALGRWFSKLSDTTVRLGPFTTSLKGLGVALTLLGPVIVGVAGALGALTGAVVAAAAGIAGLATAVGVGLVLALPGVIGVMKPLVVEMKAAFAASKAYSDAVRKYGKDSSQAADKLEQLRTTMKNIPPEAQKQIKAMGSLGDRFERLTQSSRTSFWKGMGQGLKTVSALMPQIAGRTNELFGNLSRGFSDWMRGLRSKEGRGVIDTIMGNFNKAIPSVMDGLGSLGAAIGRISASFSRAFESLGGGFAEWAAGLSDATKNTEGLDSGVDKVVTSMRSLGHWVAAAGRVLAQFFRAAMGPGTGMLDRQAASMNRLSDSMRTIEGQKGLKDFFADSIRTARELWYAIKPLASLFLEWATIMRPFANIALQITAALGKIVQKIADFGPVRGLLQAAFGIFLTGAIVSRLTAAAGAIRALGAAMLGLRGAQAGTAAIQSLSNAALATATLGRAGKQAAPAVAQTTARVAALSTASVAAGSKLGSFSNDMARARTATQTAGTAANQSMGKWAKLGAGLNVASLAMFGLSAATVGTIGGVAAVGYAIYKLSDNADQWTDSAKRTVGAAQLLDKSTQALSGSTRSAAGAHLQWERSTLGVKAAQQRVNQLVKSGQKGTDEYKLALLDLREMQNLQTLAEEESIKTMATAEKVAQKRVDSAQRLADTSRRHLREAKEAGLSEQELASYREELTWRTRLLNKELNTQAAISVNNARAVQNLSAYTGAAAQQVGQFARAFKGIPGAKKLVLQTDAPKAGAQVAKLSNQLRSVGQKSVAVKILANSKNAEQALNRMRGFLQAFQNKQYMAHVGLNAEAAKTEIERLQNRIDRIKQGKVPGLKANSAEADTQVARLQGRINAIRQAQPTQLNVNQRNAFAAIDSLLTKIARIPRSVETVHNFRTTGTPSARPHAIGGVMAAAIGSTPDPQRIERAANQASSRQVQDVTSGGRKISRPTFIVGEENKPEFVIATNPSYRRRNLGILGDAARALGAEVIAAAAGNNEMYKSPPLPKGVPIRKSKRRTGEIIFEDGARQLFHKGKLIASLGNNDGRDEPKKKRRAYYRKKMWLSKLPPGRADGGEITSAAGGRAPDPAYYAPTRLPGVPSAPMSVKKGPRGTRRLRKRRKKVYKSQNAWAHYVASLKTQQDDWEREASIRESQVLQPESFLIEKGKTPEIVAPDGSKSGGEPIYEIDQNAVNVFHAQLEQVRLAYQKLVEIVMALVQAVPRAVQSTNNEIRVRNRNAAVLKADINRDQATIRNLRNQKGGTEDEKKRREKRIAQLEKNVAANQERRSKEVDAANTLKQDRATFLEDGKEAGFDYREFGIEHGSIVREQAGLQGRANEEFEDWKKGTVGGGGGGAGGEGAGVSYERQAALADTARAQALKEFGSNFKVSPGGAAPDRAAAGAAGAAAGAAAGQAAGDAVTRAQRSGRGGGLFAGAASAAVATEVARQVSPTGGGQPGRGQDGPGRGGDKVVNVTNNFQAPPPDPHTWSQGVEFETKALI